MTVRQLAELCGVSKSTVGMALRNDPRVAARTRDRIQARAQENGYTADPRVSHLMSLLKRGRREAIWNVAWINSSDSEAAWIARPWLAGYLQGALRRAGELGYDIDQVWVQNQTPEHIAKVLKARGIQGLLIPFPEETKFWTRFPWDQFSAVVVDEIDVNLSLAHVISDRHGNMRTVLDELEKSGFRRPALWLQSRLDETRNAYSSAFLGWHHAHGRKAIPPWFFDQLEPPTLSRKIKRDRPDVIICCHNEMVTRLEQAGTSVPQTVSVVHLNLAADVAGWSGIDQRHQEIGATVMDALNGMLIKGEPGLLRHPPTVSLPGRWQPGDTTRRRTS